MRRIAALVGTALIACGCSSNTEQAATSDAGSTGGDAAQPDATDGDAAAPCPAQPVTQFPVVADPGPDSIPGALDCGTPTFPGGTGLRRYPYLQRMTAHTGTIAWTATTGQSGEVRIAPGPGGPWQSFAATAEAFPMSRTADTEDYVAYNADLTGLEDGKQYCYEVLMDGTTIASGLRLSAAWTEKARTLRVLAFGDSGSGSADQKAVRDEAMKHSFDIFVHLGDIAYGEGSFTQFEQNHFSIYRELTDLVPTYPAIGNHEYGTDKGQPYVDVFYLWEQTWRPKDKERYYSFDYGDVHFVSLDSNTEMLFPILIDFDHKQTDNMVKWLEDDLAKSHATWKIAFFHHPPFTSSDRGSDATVIKTLLPALQAGGVDLVMVGHDHHYERMYPLRGECKVPGGERAIPYLIVGTGGAGARDAKSPNAFSAVVRDQTYGFLSLSIQGCRAHGQMIKPGGEIGDEFDVGGCN